MADRVIEDLGQTLSIKRTQPGPGKDQPHITPAAGPSGPSGVGLEQVARDLRSLGAVVLDIREHVHASLPRPEDKDFSLLKQKINGDKKSDAPTARLTLDATGGANATAELHVQMTEGHRGFVTRISVRPTSPTLDVAGLDVTLTLRGVALKVASVRFARPQVVELNDEIVLKVTNTTAAPVTVEYAVEGWLRREG
jgi:hypothetical protein